MKVKGKVKGKQTPAGQHTLCPGKTWVACLEPLEGGWRLTLGIPAIIGDFKGVHIYILIAGAPIGTGKAVTLADGRERFVAGRSRLFPAVADRRHRSFGSVPPFRYTVLIITVNTLYITGVR